MTRLVLRALMPAVLACGLFAAPAPGFAQDSSSDLVVRLDQLQNEVHHLTGAVEELQYKNQQLEEVVRRMQDERAGPTARQPGPAVAPPGVPGRRSDVFDPSQTPNAPGAPRVLGSMSRDAGGAYVPPAGPAADAGTVGAPIGGQVGAPLDLSTMSANAANGGPQAGGGGPAPRNVGAPGTQLATLPPTQSPRDEFDLAYGYVLRRDYALAVQTFQDFLGKYPNDQLAGEAQFWLGESMFQRKSYRDAADAFLNLTKKYDQSPKAPDALLRLGQSLAELKEKELACATLAEVGRKYPRAAQKLRAAVEAEQKRVHC